MTVNTSHVKISVDGSQMPAYLARPDVTSGSHPAVIVLQEIFGVNAEVRRITDLVASAGYVGLAINYYHRTHPNLNEPYDQGGLERGFSAAAQVSKDTLRKDVAAALQWLNEQNFVTKGMVATWGFCFGGSVAFLSATVPGIKGAACFYPGQTAGEMPNGEPSMLEDAASIQCPVLLVFAEEDDYISPADRQKIVSALRSAGKEVQEQSYHAGHAFFRESTEIMNRDTKHSEIVADAWNLVQAFFKRVLH